MRRVPRERLRRVIFLPPACELHTAKIAHDEQGPLVCAAEGEAGSPFPGFQRANLFARPVVDRHVAVGDVDISLCVGGDRVAAAVGKEFAMR